MNRWLSSRKKWPRLASVMLIAGPILLLASGCAHVTPSIIPSHDLCSNKHMPVDLYPDEWAALSPEHSENITGLDHDYDCTCLKNKPAYCK